MALQASVVLNRAETTLFDDTNVRWSAAELLDYLNAAISAVMINKPDAYALTSNVPLVVGSSKQEIAAAALQLVDIHRVTNGGAMRQIQRNHLDHTNQDWHTTSGVPKHFVLDPRNVRVFWVYPVPSVATSVEMTVYSTPTRLTAASDLIPFNDLYENPLYYYTVGMAYAKNTTRGDLAKATAYFTLFANSIGAKSQVQFALSPMPPGSTEGSER